ncbi:MAG: PEP-CTERM sorting domain-containing protein [Opitutaceae bacterium]|nr:PEP-CTERM sorting domain-containing protein [Opitutaceae bacterium]
MKRVLLTFAFSVAALPVWAAEPAQGSEHEKLTAGIQAPEQVEAKVDDDGLATERLAPDLHLESSSLSGKWIPPAPSTSKAIDNPSSIGGTAETERENLQPLVPSTGSLSAPRALAPIEVTQPGAALVRTSGPSAGTSLVAVTTQARQSIAFFSAINAPEQRIERAALVSRQVLSPMGQGKIGEDSFADGLILESGGIYYFDLVGTGRSVRTDQIWASSLSQTATPDNPFVIELASYSSPNTPGLLPRTGFNPAAAYEWVLISSNKLLSFDVDGIVVDDSKFQNGLNGGFFSLDTAGNSLVLNFTPVPEPSTWIMLIAGAGALALLARRGKRA